MLPSELQARLTLIEEYINLASKELHNVRELVNLQTQVNHDSPLIEVLELSQRDDEAEWGDGG